MKIHSLGKRGVRIIGFKFQSRASEQEIVLRLRLSEHQNSSSVLMEGSFKENHLFISVAICKRISLEQLTVSGFKRMAFFALQRLHIIRKIKEI